MIKLMKNSFFTYIYFFICLIAAVGCGGHGKNMGTQSVDNGFDMQEERRMFYCWYVENNGVGGKGYAIMDTAVGVPLTPGEHLFSSLQEVQQALRRSGAKPPVIVPRHPEWVPEHWRVRDLTSREFKELQIVGKNK